MSISRGYNTTAKGKTYRKKLRKKEEEKQNKCIECGYILDQKDVHDLERHYIRTGHTMYKLLADTTKWRGFYGRIDTNCRLD